MDARTLVLKGSKVALEVASKIVVRRICLQPPVLRHSDPGALGTLHKLGSTICVKMLSNNMSIKHVLVKKISIAEGCRSRKTTPNAAIGQLPANVVGLMTIAFVDYLNML